MIRHLGPALFVTRLVASLAFAATALTGEAAPKTGTETQKASTSPSERREAIQSIPADRLTPAARAKVKWVLENTSVYRRLPLRVVICDADLYQFLTQHPDVVVNIWETLGVSHLAMRQAGPDTYQVSDDAGTSGTLQYLYRSRDLQVIYVDGRYSGRAFGQNVHGRGVMVLRSGFVRDVDGRCFVTSRLDAFMNVEPGTAEFLTKTFQPWVGKVADYNFIQVADFLGSLSRTAEVNLPGMKRLAGRLEKVQPEVRRQFAEMAEQVAQRAGKSDEEAGSPVVTETTQTPQREPRVAQRTPVAESPPVNQATPAPLPTP